METVSEALNQYKWPILLSFLGLVLILGGVSLNKPKAKVEYSAKSMVGSSPAKSIKVDVAGAVETPGVYSLTTDSRVEDAINLAGGFDPKVSQEYISKTLNLSQKVSDGQKIYIPFKGEKGVVISSVSGSSGGSGKAGINTGTSSELEALPSIGAVTASKIISGRPYNDPYDLVSKKIISKTTYDKIKDLIDLH